MGRGRWGVVGQSMTHTKVCIAVVDRTGLPVPNAGVSVVDSSVPFPEIALLSDENGVVRVFLPAGHYTFKAHGPGRTQGTTRVVSNGSSMAAGAEIVVI